MPTDGGGRDRTNELALFFRMMFRAVLLSSATEVSIYGIT